MTPLMLELTKINLSIGSNKLAKIKKKSDMMWQDLRISWKF